MTMPRSQKTLEALPIYYVFTKSISIGNCLWQLRVQPRGVEIDPFSTEGPILELL
jgi:hypothetical protein